MGRPLNHKYFTGSPALIAHAYVVDDNQVRNASIDKQTSDNEYKMTTAGGTSICTLVADNTPDEGQAYITATDALGSTYFVLNLEAHLVVLDQDTDGGSGFVWNSGDEAPWLLDITDDASGLVVELENA